MNTIIGQKFGKLTVQSFSRQDTYKHNFWNCVCDCGQITESSTRQLRSGRKKSCGCLQKLVGSENKSWKGHGEISLSLWNKIQREAKERNLDFTISIEYVWNLLQKQLFTCALSGRVIALGKSKADERTASLDRIDSTKGYVKGNVQWVHKHINMMKQAFSEKDFLDLVSDVAEFKGL